MKLSDEIVLYLYQVSRTTPMQYVPYSQLFNQSKGSASENDFTAALRYLVGKRYIQEEAAHYRIISEGEEYAQNLLHPPVDYPKESFHEQRRGNEVQEKNYIVAIAALTVTLLLGCLSILVPYIVKNSQSQNIQPQISPTFPQPILNPIVIAPTATAQTFSSLYFCYRNELDVNNQCQVSRTTFVSPVTEVCVSWSLSQYSGSSFKRVWRNNSTGESRTNENFNNYGCLSWTPSLSVGQYEIELYANNVYIQKGNFLITTSASNVPLMLQISERQGNGDNGLIIYKDIYFVDPDGDAYVVAYKLLSTSLNPSAITVKNDSIKSTPDEQKKGAIVVGAWECGYKYSNYSVILEARILDNAGNQSEPFVLEFNCK